MALKTLYLYRSNCTLFDQVHNQLFVLLGSYIITKLFPPVCWLKLYFVMYTSCIHVLQATSCKYGIFWVVYSSILFLKSVFSL